MAVSAALAAGVGLLLGLLAAVEALPAARWSGAVQAHQDIQLLGWAAVFISALAFEFVIRLNQSEALSERWRLAGLSGLALGAVVQATGQLFGQQLEWLWAPGAVLSTAGACIVAALIWSVKPGFAPDSAIHALWLRSAVAWLVVLAAAGVGAAARGSEGVARLPDAALVAEIFIRGFAMPLIVGIAFRAFPGHLGLTPVPPGRQLLLMVSLQLSLLGWGLGSGGFGLPEISGLQRGADILLAVTLLFATQSLGVAHAFRWDWAPPRHRLVLPWAWAGLIVYSLTLGIVALLPGWEDRTLFEVGAVRHLFLLGFMAPLMVAMAHIVLERFALGELVAPRTLLASFLLLEAAWPLRAFPAIADAPERLTRDLLGTSGVLAIAGLSLLAVACWRTSSALRRRQRPSGPSSQLLQP